MKKQRKRQTIIELASLFCLLFLVSCGKQKSAEEGIDTGFTAAKAGIFDSADTAVVAKIDMDAKTVTLKNMEKKRQYTLSYDGTTFFYDKYGKVISVSQLQKGEVVDVAFFKEKKRLSSLQVSGDAWCRKYIDEYKLNEETFQAQVGSALYAYSEDIVVISDGKQGDLIDINPVDVLTFRGIGSDIYSVVVERGHGYIRLKNEEYFYGGWIEVGKKTIQRVSENMMLTVPEGSHQVIISNKGTSGVKQIEVHKDMELELDVGDLKGEEPRYGDVVFTITPKEAVLYLDGDKTDYSAPVRLEYGIHQMIVMAEGYETISQYLKVGQVSAGIEVTMKKKEDVSGNDVSSNDVSGNNTISNNALLDEINRLLNEKGYSGITADDLAKNQNVGQSGNGNSGTTNNTDTNSSSGTTNNAGTNSSNQTTAKPPVTSTLNYYVTIESPTGAEVYLDGNYIGLAPCSFKKEEGSHTVTLRKNGHVAKSYTIRVDTEEKNVSYSFLDLEKMKQQE